MTKCFKYIALLLLVFGFSTAIYADDSPPDTINSFQMAATVGKHYFQYMHWRPIGTCVWMHWAAFVPYLTFTMELEDYQPDLVVTTYNESGDDPWKEANFAFDKISQKTGNVLMQQVSGDDLTDGHNTGVRGEQHNSSDITKSVDVIGSPTNLFHFPYLTLRSDTTPFVPYFQSALDSVPGRLGIAEALRLETWNPIGNYIGSSFLHHWAYEFPRSMSVDNDNDYKASVSIALHATDIVTNKNTLHVVNSTQDSCGTNCAVANVIEENDDNNEIWQEVYPDDNHIVLGQDDLTSTTPVGQGDDNDGHGNYVFVVWRRYKGCIQSSGGKFLWATVMVPPTVKR